MRIALSSDIHANLPAISAVLADIDGRRPDIVYCLGDLTGYSIRPNKVVNTIRYMYSSGIGSMGGKGKES